MATTTDIDSLPPTEYLILEVLAARHRLGEQLWTFPNQPRLVAAAHMLARRGLIGVKSGVAPASIQAWLTEGGRSATLSDSYEAPILSEVARIRADTWAAARAVVEAIDFGASDKLMQAALRGFRDDAVIRMRVYQAASRIEGGVPAESVVGAPTPAAATGGQDCPNCRRYGTPARVEHCGPGCHEAHTYVAPCELAGEALPEDEGTRQPCCAEFARTGSAHTEACCWLGEEL